MEQVYIKDKEGNKVLPITSDKAVRDENGNPLDSRLNDIKDALDARYTKQETYSKNQLNNLITTPNQKYVTVTATDQTTAVTDVLPATGAADTVYRVGNWDDTQYNTTCYTEYAWDGSAYVPLDVKEYIIDDVPTAGSANLVKSGGVFESGAFVGKQEIYEVEHLPINTW